MIGLGAVLKPNDELSTEQRRRFKKRGNFCLAFNQILKTIFRHTSNLFFSISKNFPAKPLITPH